MNSIDIFKKIFNFFNDDTPYYAASLSFFTIFSLLPLLALLIVVISTLPIFAQYVDSIMLYILDFINPIHFSSLTSSIESFLINTNKLGNIGILYLFFVFSMFFKDYEYIINKIYNTPSRAVYKLFFMYLGFLILIPTLFFIFIFISTLTKLSFPIHIFTFIFIWIMFIILFTLSANTKVSIIASSFSSLITLIVLSATKSLFGYYVIANTTYATIYGSFSVVLFFFLWIYISWSIYLYGTKLCSIINKGNSKYDH